MFTSGWQLTLMKRMKKRLTETADHYRSLASHCDATSTAATTHIAQRRELYEKLDRSAIPIGHCLITVNNSNNSIVVTNNN